MRVAIVGIRGLPNTYGGFETLADFLVQKLAKHFELTVYCSSVDMKAKSREYLGARLIYIPVTSHGAWGMLYDSLALLDAVRKHDKVLFLGFGGGFIMPFLGKYKKKIILNIGGLDWQRNKWSQQAQRVIKRAERLLVQNSGQIVSDNVGIQRYLQAEYGRQSQFIAYGGDQVQKIAITKKRNGKYRFLNSMYAFTVARIQPDNNIDMIIEAFVQQHDLPLVFVGNWQNSAYGRATKRKYEGRKNVILLEAIYDRQELDLLRSNCTIYVHGHSAGGTNPALVEAMHLALPVFAYASGYNENTTENQAIYFNDAEELRRLILNFRSVNLRQMGAKLKAIANKSYRWEVVAERYKEVLQS